MKVLSMTYYASLVNNFLGFYIKLPFDTELKNRVLLITSPLKKDWGSIYTKNETQEQILEFNGTILPDRFTKELEEMNPNIKYHLISYLGLAL